MPIQLLPTAVSLLKKQLILKWLYVNIYTCEPVNEGKIVIQYVIITKLDIILEDTICL